MNFQETSRHTRLQEGFSLLELLLVVALMMVIGALMSPIGISFYQSQVLNESADSVRSALRQAQSFSITGKNNHSYGVHFEAGVFTLFEGETYTTRLVSEDITIPVPPSVSVTSPSDIAFSPFSGEPSATGEITFSIGTKERVIEVLPSGNID